MPEAIKKSFLVSNGIGNAIMLAATKSWRWAYEFVAIARQEQERAARDAVKRGEPLDIELTGLPRVWL